MRKVISCSMGAMIGVAATLGAVNSSIAGVFPVGNVALKTAAPQDVTEIRYRNHYRYHHRYGGAIFAGMAMSLIGAAIAGNYYASPYYSPYYYGYTYAPYPYAPYAWGYSSAYPVW
jgi:hypothetical protein